MKKEYPGFLGAYQQALDEAYDREQERLEAAEAEIQARQLEYRGDGFDLFCRQQRARLSSKLERSVTRVKQHWDDEEAFESRK